MKSFDLTQLIATMYAMAFCFAALAYTVNKAGDLVSAFENFVIRLRRLMKTLGRRSRHR
jgi:hypothetical protein